MPDRTDGVADVDGPPRSAMMKLWVVRHDGQIVKH
jgi:hypothetical protein